MSLLSRLRHALRPGRLHRDLEEELASHLAEAAAAGRDPDEARRALGPALHHREASYDLRTAGWLDALRADAVFGWRQLRKAPVTTAAAVLSLSLALGACLAAFRLGDALLWRPLPVAGADRLYTFLRTVPGPDGTLRSFDGAAYPMFARMREAARGQADLLAVSFAERRDLTLGSSPDVEKATWQFVSGSLFPTFGLQPAAGRLLTPADDLRPGGHPLAVLSHEYWTRRFAADPAAIGSTFRQAGTLYQIVGVAPAGFTGTEPGIAVDLFVPAMMEPAVVRDDSTWLRVLAVLTPGTAPGPLAGRLDAVARAFEQERARSFGDLPKEYLKRFLQQRGALELTPAGASGIQTEQRGALQALGGLVALVLAICCVNLTNLMTARSAARAREMAMRISLGAGRARLVQLVMVESAWIAGLATLGGALFAVWAAPLLAGLMHPADDPVRLSLPLDPRVGAFAVAMAAAVTALLGLAPALRASGIRPAAALKGGEDPHARRRLMRILIVAQVAFCFLVLLGGTLLVTTYRRLTAAPLGFSPEQVLVLHTVSEEARFPALWQQLAERLAGLPGIESVAVADRAPLDGSSWNGFVTVDGAPPNDTLVFFRAVSPAWRTTLRVPLLAGRELNGDDRSPDAAMINETFARIYFPGRDPIGQSFTRGTGAPPSRIVGVVGDALYRNLRDPLLPVAYYPFAARPASGIAEKRARATLLVRTAPGVTGVAAALRQHTGQVPGSFRVSMLRSEQEIIDTHTVRERMLALLAVFFAGVALLLAGIGLYGVLDYAVLQRRREIGIRMALGARAFDVGRRVAIDALVLVWAGAALGLAAGLAGERFLAALVYRVRATDPAMVLGPGLALLIVAALAVAPAVLRAARTDPAVTLRAE